MKKTYFIILLLAASFSQTKLYAQCPSGEIELEIFIETDSYAYEGYWELVNSGDGCGNNPIASGGNSAVGCNGGGIKNQPSGGYSNNQVFSAGTWCVKLDSLFDLHYIDDWGDGGFGFTVTANGYEVLAIDGIGATHVWSFIAQEPPAIDAEMDHIKTPYSYSPSGNTDLIASFSNRGKDTISTIDVNYTVDGGATQSSTLSGLSIAYGDHHEFTHPTSFNLNNGQHTIKVWTSNVNGQVDSIPQNDTLNFAFEVGAGIPNIIDQYLQVTTNQNEIINQSNQLNKPTDLDFHPVLSRKELWVVNKRTESQGGSTVTVSNAGEPNQTSVHNVDGNAWHFMSLPTGLAFGENENFGTSPGVFDANHNGGTPFTGPALWSSDTSIYAQPSGGNGSHLDMLHNSPKCQGIAHEVDNVFWVFDGQSNDIVRYDFADDHGPGASYHGDAIVHRYRDYSVAKDPQEKVVSHLVVDKATNWLYVVDNGNQRVMRLDITSGTKGSNSNIYNYEPVEEYKNIVGYTWETVVDSGLSKPAGIDVIDDRMIVSDYATGEIIIYDISVIPAIEKGRITTGAQGIMGVKIGPEGRIWYVDYDANKVYRVDGTGLSVEESEELSLNLYPNPSNGSFTIRLDENSPVQVTVVNLLGQKVFENEYNESTIQLDLNLASGTYFVRIQDSNSTAFSIKKVVVQ
jgi:hypothetical protein